MENITILIKPSSSDCNLDCKYCFYKDSSRNRETYSYGFMNDDTLESVIKNTLNQNILNCNFMFQGGEPTLVGLKFYEKAILLQKKYNKKNINITNSIQTNGINLDENFIKFFKENNFLVGISLDGPKYIHDLNRKYYDDSGTFDDVISTIIMLKKHKVNFNILSVVTKYSSNYVDIIYEFYKNQGFNYLQFIPCIKEYNNPTEKDYYLDSDTYYNFLDKLFNLWSEDIINEKFIEIRNFMDYINVIKGYNPTSCGMGGFCSLHTVVESNGDVYPCDFYCFDEWKLGNIKNNSLYDIRNNDLARKFFERSLYIHEKCKKCNYFKLCGGGCRRNQEPFINGIPTHNYQCEGIKKFLDKNLKKLIYLSKYYT